jgi:hypothetical protein
MLHPSEDTCSPSRPSRHILIVITHCWHRDHVKCSGPRCGARGKGDSPPKEAVEETIEEKERREREEREERERAREQREKRRKEKESQYEDAAAMKARLIREIEEAKALGPNASEEQRLRLVQEIEHLKMEMERRRRKKQQEEEDRAAEEMEDVAYLPEEQAEGGGDEEEGGDVNTPAGEASDKPLPPPAAPKGKVVVGNPARRKHLDTLHQRVRMCGKRAGAASATLDHFPLGFPDDLAAEDIFLHQALVAKAPKDSTTATYAANLLPETGADVMGRHTWARCAVVGNSGMVAGGGKGAEVLLLADVP